jgi:hypothetical protein
MSHVGGRELEVRIVLPQRQPLREVRLHCPHPDHLPIRQVIVNGRPHAEFDGQWITLPSQQDVRIQVKF